MINKIIDGISKALNNEFGDDYEIYTENVEQGLQEPCFLIALVSPAIKQFLGNRYYRTHLFCIYYFPKLKNESKQECFEVAERLMNALEYIQVREDLLRGERMHVELTDGVLAFMVNYNLFVNKERKVQASMSSLVQKSNIRKENEE